MSLYEYNSREFKRVTRIWMACDSCDLRIDFTVDKGHEASMVADFRANHVCVKPERAA